VSSSAGGTATGPFSTVRHAAITNAVTETTRVRVTINGGPVQYLRLVGYDGVVGLHPGRNTLIVRWDGPVKRLDFKITYSTSPDNAKDGTGNSSSRSRAARGAVSIRSNAR
jgi:hypothetical protein